MCTDTKDKCSYNNGGCSSLATCIDTHKGRRCLCNEGYTGDGITCGGEFTIAGVNVGINVLMLNTNNCTLLLYHIMAHRVEFHHYLCFLPVDMALSSLGDIANGL